MEIFTRIGLITLLAALLLPAGVRAELGLEESDSAVVSLGLAADFDAARLDGLHTAMRAGRVRAGFHLYNSDHDAARLLQAICG